GNSGRSTGPHLHLTLKDTKKGRAIDPSILLNLIKHPL
ncbi:M23 family peptidase, partial [Phocaeicola vulgatus]